MASHEIPVVAPSAPILEWAVTAIIIVQIALLLVAVCMIFLWKLRGPLRYSALVERNPNHPLWVQVLQTSFARAAKLLMPLCVCVFGAMAFLVSNGAAMSSLLVIPVGDLTPSFWLVFNIIVSGLVYLFDLLAVWQVSCISHRHYLLLEKNFHADGVAQKVFVPMALASVGTTAKHLANAISDGKRYDDLCKEGLNAPQMGIVDIGNTPKEIRDAETSVDQLMRAEETIRIEFFRLRQWPDDTYKLLESLFLSILNGTVVPLLTKTQQLTDSVSRPVAFPVSFVEQVWSDALRITQEVDHYGRGPLRPMATCMLPFKHFYHTYDRYVYRKPPEVHTTEGNRPKARRIFIMRGGAWRDEVTNESLNLRFGGAMRMQLPRSLEDHPEGRWMARDPICHLAWCVQLHYLENWSVKFISSNRLDELWEHVPPTLSYKDFLVVPVAHDRQLVFSADVEGIREDRRALGGIVTQLCETQVSLTSTDHTGFYDRLWTAASTPSEFIMSVAMGNELLTDCASTIAAFT